MSLQLPIFGPLCCCESCPGPGWREERLGCSWAVLALLGFWYRAEPWHCPFGDRVKSQSPPPLHLTGETSSRLLASAQGFLSFLPSLWHWGSSFPSLAISHLSCCPAWSIPWDSCAQVSSAEHRSPQPGLWKNSLNYNISEDFTRFPRGRKTLGTEQ